MRPESKAFRAYTTALNGLHAVPVIIEVLSAQVHVRMETCHVTGIETGAGKRLVEEVSVSLRSVGFVTDWQGLSIGVRGHIEDLRSIGLACAAVLLVATGQADAGMLRENLFLGALDQDGIVLPSKGILAHARLARIHGLTLVCADSPYLADVPWNCRCLISSVAALRHRLRPTPVTVTGTWGTRARVLAPVREVWGCSRAKRAIAIAVAGGHALALVSGSRDTLMQLVSGMQYLAPRLSRHEREHVALVRSVTGLDKGSESFGVRPLECVTGDGEGLDEALARACFGILFLVDACTLKEDFLYAVREALDVGESTHAGEGKPRPSSNTLLVVGVRADEVVLQTTVAQSALACVDISCVVDLNDVVDDRRQDWNTLARQVAAARTFSVRRRARSQESPAMPDGDVERLVETIAAKEGHLFVSDELRRVCQVARTIADLAQTETIGACHVREALDLTGGTTLT